MNNETPHIDINSQEVCKSSEHVIRFVYRQSQMSLWNLSKRVITHNICMTGIPGDHIYEVIKQTKTFYEAGALTTISHWVNGSLRLVLDIGANIGNHTVFFAKVLGASVISVEPSPRAASLLQANIKLNGIDDRVKIIECAVGNKSGQITLVEPSPTNIGASYVAENCSNCENHTIVRIQPIDEIVDELDKDKSFNISLVKIDVEGFEQQVLKGATRIIQKHRPIIVIETHKSETFLQIRAMLSKYGYGAPIKLFAASPTYLFDKGFRRVRQLSLHRARRIYHKLRICVSDLL